MEFKIFKEVIEEHNELPLLIEALDALEKKCRGYANRTTLGYGTVSEQMKKDIWENKADSIREIQNKISQQYY